ncbi:3'-tRNA processing endoribonuclease [Sarocladium implicatum]|nr:3'-tRNA processing endoribonuclease [Sarocladium implicatum]
MPQFATPLPQSPRSPILTLTFPSPHNTLSLLGRSRAAWHTSFIVPQLNLLLDAGLFVSEKLRPKHIFLTHGHSDHTLVTFSFVKRDDPPDVVCPWEMARALDEVVMGHTLLNLGGLIEREDGRQAKNAEVEEEEDVDPEQDAKKKTTTKKNGPKNGKSIKNGITPDDALTRYTTWPRQHRSPAAQSFLNTHITHALSPSDSIPLRRHPEITATAFSCDHTVPSLGYLFSRTTLKLNPSYSSLSPSELSSLRSSGVQLTVPHTVPIFAFLGDGTAKTLASSPPWLAGTDPSLNYQKVALVITECSFLREEHRAQAEKTKHTIWGDLEPVVRRWPETTFVLTHFSLRYSERDVVEFFDELEDCPKNIVVWADPEG